MKRAVFIVAGPFLLLLVLLGGHYLARQRQGPLSKIPERGVCFTIRAELERAQSTNAVPELKQAIQGRFARFGVRVFWEPVSQEQFRIYAPIVDDEAIAEAGGLVSRRGILEFRLVHSEKPALLSSQEGYETMELQHRAGSGADEVAVRYLVSKTAEGGTNGLKLRRAMVNRNSATGKYEVFFNLTPDSAEAFRRITRDNIGRQLAIVMDGGLLSAPVIRAEIPSGSGVIAGNYDRVSAVRLATLMETPLPIPVKLLATKTF